MRYESTRSTVSAAKSFSEILLEGLAPDGGLFVPESYPRVDASTRRQWRGLSYSALAFEVLRLFVDDISETALRNIVSRTYTAAIFGSPDITPVVPMGPGQYLLRLSGGPTMAFKDIAMQLLGALFEQVLASCKRSATIVGATSGDTGSAAEYAMRNRPHISVFMLSPYGKMSSFQTAQMFSLQAPNIFNIAVQGNFDACQDLVKAVSTDAAFKSQYAVSAVNSINWARIAAQVVYYFKAYFAVTQQETDCVSFAVPTGNFGNVLAGYVARQMGLPIARLVVATNENDVLHEFFQTGCYHPRAADQTCHTSSPSMDISKASNFERFVHDCVKRDKSCVAKMWQTLETRGTFQLDLHAVDHGMVSGCSRHADRMATIRRIWAQHQRLIDPHTADGVHVAQAFREPGVPMICLETALAQKFFPTMKEALGESVASRHLPVFDDFFGIEGAVQRFFLMPNQVELLKQFIATRCVQ